MKRISATNSAISFRRYSPVAHLRRAFLTIPGLPIWMAIAVASSFPSTGFAYNVAQASDLVKALPCKDSSTVDQILDISVKSHSQRDMGWRAFQEADYIDVERAVLISKGMELRYRWRVAADNSIQPQNDRAEKLCTVPN